MKNLGNSVARYRNAGAQFAFIVMIIVILVIIALPFFAKLDSMAITMLIFVIVVFTALDVYMFFKAKTEMDIREHGIFIRNVRKSHEILYDEIAEFDKTRRVGKSGNVIIIYYLLVIVKKDGERITCPCRVTEEFFAKLLEVSHL